MKHVANIANVAEAELIKKSEIGYDAFLYTDFVSEVIVNTAKDYCNNNGWYGNVKNRFDMDTVDLLLSACQLIAGNSPNIERSFDGMYRKDMFRDVCLAALRQDIYLKLKEKYDYINCYSFLQRCN